MNNIILVICVFLLASGAFSSSIVLKPVRNIEDTVTIKAAIFIPGGKVPVENYTLTAQAIQNYTESALWVGIPECPLNLCDPLDRISNEKLL